MSTGYVEKAELNAVAQFEANLEIARDRLGADVYDQLFQAAASHDVGSIKVQA